LNSRVSELIAADIESYLRSHENKTLLRFITCGGVDDGKSTLIGRLLYESKVLFDDQLAALADDSKKFGTQGGQLDFALLVDGLAAEREQGITIDVAYRFFSTDRRKFIVADTPGHEQYTRNMVTGASTADAAVILVDARNGVLTQTRRHTYLVSLLGVRHVALAINKMDLVGYSEARFRRIETEYRDFANRIGLTDITCIPLSALKGDNILAPSANIPWHHGATVMGWLEAVEVGNDRQLHKLPFRFPVQWVNRPGMDFRGFSGTVVSGTAKPGDRIRVQPSGKESRVERIVTFDGDLPCAATGQSVTLTLTDELDISRGDLISSIDNPAEVAAQFEATIVWMSEQPLLRGRSYLMKIGPKMVTTTVAPIKYQVNVNTLEHVAAEKLELNAIGVCELELDQTISFDPYAENRDTGGFVLIDRITNQTVGAGMLRFALRRAHNIHIQPIDIDKAARAAIKHQTPCLVWFTGLSGAGKSTIANLVDRKLHTMGYHTYMLDGDNVRHGLNKDLGFTAEDRVENIRRIAEVGKLMLDAGLIVLAAFISPFRAERRMARSLVQPDEFVEVFVNVPLRLAEQRDPKGLYKKARLGELKNFTGVDSPYEEPETPEITLDTAKLSPEESADCVIAVLRRMGVVRDVDITCADGPIP
jgi:bifunctional enzyme CysN/CysC